MVFNKLQQLNQLLKKHGFSGGGFKQRSGRRGIYDFHSPLEIQTPNDWHNPRSLNMLASYFKSGIMADGSTSGGGWKAWSGQNQAKDAKKFAKKAQWFTTSAQIAAENAKKIRESYSSRLSETSARLGAEGARYQAAAERNQNELTNIFNQNKQLEQSLALNKLQVEEETSSFNRKKADFEKQVSNYESGGKELESLVKMFHTSAQQLGTDTAEYNKLPSNFQKRFDALSREKSKYSGFNDYEMDKNQRESYKEKLSKLKGEKTQLEKAIKNKFNILKSAQANLASKKRQIEDIGANRQRTANYLLQKQANLASQKARISNLMDSYNMGRQNILSNIDRAKRLQAENVNYKSKIDNLKSAFKEAASISKQDQNTLNFLKDIYDISVSKSKEWQGKAGWKTSSAISHSKQFKKIAPIAGGALGLLSGGLAFGFTPAAAGASTWGASSGSSWLTKGALAGAAAGTGAGSLLGSLNQINLPQNANFNIPKFNPGNLSANINYLHKDASYLGSAAPISSGMLGGAPKINMPNLGGWQSVKHFGMPQLPSQAQLPSLEEALGKITKAGDPDKLALGYMQGSSRSGKKYNQGIMLGDFFDKLKKSSYHAGGLGMSALLDKKNRLKKWGRSKAVAV